MFSNFFKGISSYSRAFGLISEMKLWGFLILPGLLGLLLAALIGSTAWSFHDELGLFLLSWFPHRFSDLLSGLTGFLSGLLILTLGIFLFKYILLIILSPFMSPLSQKVEEHLTGRKSPDTGFRMSQAIKDIIRGLRIALRNIFRELFFTLVLLLFSLVPVVGVLSVVLLFLMQAYYAGFGNMDYTLERHLNLGKSVRFIRRHRGLAMGNGTVFLLLISTGIGVLIAPTLATIAGTVETVQRLEEEEKHHLDFV